MKNFDNNYVEILIKNARFSITCQQLLYNLCKEIVYPVYRSMLSYAKAYGCNEDELNACLDDAFMKLIYEPTRTFTNFDSFFRKSYEFCVLDFIKTNKRYYEKVSPKDDFDLLFDDTNSLKKYDETGLIEKSIESDIFDYIDVNREKFRYLEIIILNYLSIGLSLYEIKEKMGCSYSKISFNYKSLISKLQIAFGQDKNNLKNAKK